MPNPLLEKKESHEDPSPWYALYHKTQGWLVDSCAGGTYSDDFGASAWYDTAEWAWQVLDDSDIPREGHEIAKISIIKDGGNHYKIEWPDRPCNLVGAVFLA